MSTQTTHARKERWYREDDKCPSCQDGRIKICKRNDDGRLFLGCSNFRKTLTHCKFNADIPERPGYVYVLSNPGYRLNGVDVVKIGYTNQTMKATLDQIYKTGVPFQFNVEFQAMVWKAWATMRQVHITLQTKRLNPDEIERDFFVCSIQEAVEVLKTAVQGDISYKTERPPQLQIADDNVDPETYVEPDNTENRRARTETWHALKRTDTPGFVYVLANDVYHDENAPLLKIGYTTWKPEDRADALYRWDHKHLDYRGVPQRFKVVYCTRFERAFDAEQNVHKALEAFRANQHREFFVCTLVQARAAIQTEFNREVRAKAEREALEQARNAQDAKQPHEQQQEVEQQEACPTPIQAYVPLQQPSLNLPIQKRRWARWIVLKGFVVTCLVGVLYVFSQWSNWMDPNAAPASQPAIQTPVASHKNKAMPSRPTRKKRHHSMKKRFPNRSPVESVQQNDLKPPGSADQDNQGAAPGSNGN